MCFHVRGFHDCWNCAWWWSDNLVLEITLWTILCKSNVLLINGVPYQPLLIVADLLWILEKMFCKELPSWSPFPGDFNKALLGGPISVSEQLCFCFFYSWYLHSLYVCLGGVDSWWWACTYPIVSSRMLREGTVIEFIYMWGIININHKIIGTVSIHSCQSRVVRIGIFCLHFYMTLMCINIILMV